MSLDHSRADRRAMLPVHSGAPVSRRRENNEGVGVDRKITRLYHACARFKGEDGRVVFLVILIKSTDRSTARYVHLDKASAIGKAQCRGRGLSRRDLVAGAEPCIWISGFSIPPGVRAARRRRQPRTCRSRSLCQYYRLNSSRKANIEVGRGHPGRERTATASTW